MPENQVESLPGPERVRTWAAHHAQKCLKIRLCPCRGQNSYWIWPTHYIPENAQNAWEHNCVLDIACTPCCLRAPKNLHASLLWPGFVADMAYTPCPKNCPEMPENQAASLSHPGYGLHSMS
ncbi:Hypothetical predicted protein [Olea europaea subsp. europaea]|uniref:Uncharacterized protein n=1 Tax=Olea europaea subsp. europaea TaxID=158383 RepID=A0A8S0S7D2_OLEEU|nr:Hypothetical predicted protein [Olea europaea subsp. europaea]